MANRSSATARVADVVRSAIRRHSQELGQGPLVLAVSGGTDSLALLLATSSLSPRDRPSLLVAHFSHGLRPSAELREAALVRRVAATVGIDVAQGKAKVKPTEAGARDARYEFLASVADEHGASAVATAHTEDDQAETVLLRLTRGAGLAGVGAIHELSSRKTDARDLQLLRPLLTVSRTETASVCAEGDVQPASDGSNRSLRFARNRVRHRVLAELAHINPEVRFALARFAASAQNDEALLRSLAADGIAGAESRTASEIVWRRAALAELPRPLLIRVLLNGWEHLAGEGAMLSRAKIEAAMRLVDSPEGGELSLGRTVTLVVEQESCKLALDKSDAATLGVATVSGQRLAVPGVTLTGAWRITVDVGHDTTIAAEDRGWQAVLDAKSAGNQLCVRSRRRGDRFHPLGMEQPMRLQDVLVNAKVPRSERDSLPLVVGHHGIAWVPGVRVSEWARVTERTTAVLRIRVEPEG